MTRTPVTAADLTHAVRLAVATLRAAPVGWDRRAGTLEWSCWETAEHLADDLLFYAAQLGPEQPPRTTEVPFRMVSLRPGGPVNLIHADRAAGPEGLLQVVEASGALLAAVVRVTPPEVRAYHVYGVSDAEGFAAMGLVETLVHTHDLALGLELAWSPPAGLCERALHRLFPDVPVADPWPTLLWATGRAELDGRPRRTAWRWDGTPPNS